MRSAAQTPILHKRIFRVLPIFRTNFSHVISQITFRTFAFHISQITITRIQVFWERNLHKSSEAAGAYTHNFFSKFIKGIFARGVLAGFKRGFFVGLCIEK